MGCNLSQQDSSRRLMSDPFPEMCGPYPAQPSYGRPFLSVSVMYEQTFSNKMCGTRPFTLRDLTRIADFFDVSVDFLLGRSDYAKPLEVA